MRPANGFATHRTVEIANGITPRLQWMYNYGYCGETSLISAGLFYGQYLSQYDARHLAHPNIPQSQDASQLLLTLNAARVARRMHLQTVEWNSGDRSSRDFLAWVKQNVARGYPVAIGVYTNESYFYGRSGVNDGDPSYDHIVPVVAVESHHPRNDPRYYGDDTIVFSDNGLNAPDAGEIGPHPGHWRPLYKYLYRYSFASFARTRSQANARQSPPYSLALAGPRPLPADYGIAVSGVIDPKHETLPVRIATDKYYEWPPILKYQKVRPKPEPLRLTATVSELVPGVAYTLYRYDAFASVPDADFNARAKQASQQWSIRIRSGSSFTLIQNITSNQTVIYRAVKAASP